MPTIFIKIISSEDKKIKRLKNRQEENEIVIPYYGHQESKSRVVTEEEYNKIKERKIYDLEDSMYDYFINTTLDELKINLKDIIEDIKKKYKKKEIAIACSFFFNID